MKTKLKRKFDGKQFFDALKKTKLKKNDYVLLTFKVGTSTFRKCFINNVCVHINKYEQQCIVGKFNTGKEVCFLISEIMQAETFTKAGLKKKITGMLPHVVQEERYFEKLKTQLLDAMLDIN